MSPIERRFILHANWPLIGCTLLLVTIGLINLYSASSIRTEDGYYVQAFFKKQLVWSGAGLICLFLSASFDYRHLKTLAIPIFILSLVLLALVPSFGIVVNHAKRWLSFGLFNLQPSEVAKIGILLMGATLLSNYNHALHWGGLFFVTIICSIPCLLVFIQPDLGTTLNLYLLLAGMILYTGVHFSVFITCSIVLPMLGYLGWVHLLLDYQRTRILAFINPTKASAKSLYHISQSKITIGSGEMWGNAFMGGTQSKLRFLPEKHTDFAVAVFSEEWGFIGSVTLITLFCLFLLTIIKTTRDAKDRFGSILCAGIFFYFFWQILINIAMVTGIMPVVGIPLPFISYGGTTMLVNCILLGFVLSVSMRRFMFTATY